MLTRIWLPPLWCLAGSKDSGPYAFAFIKHMAKL